MENSGEKQTTEETAAPQNETTAVQPSESNAPPAPAGEQNNAEVVSSDSNTNAQIETGTTVESIGPPAAESNVEPVNNCTNIQDLELTELKVRLVCLEKNNMALKMELKCAELQMQAKAKVDVQKTRLVELLDAKVTSLEKKNRHLMDMLEGLLKEKDTHTHRLIDATKRMEDLAAKLAESERMRNELRNMNQELKTMLGNIEDKGSQIAKMAKEKILKYKEETQRMQQELDGMKRSAPGAAAPEEAGAADGEKADRFQQRWKKIEDLLQQLVNGGNAGGTPEGIATEIRLAVEQLRAEINTALVANEDESEKLRRELLSIQPIVVELQSLSQDPGKSTDASGNPSDDQEIGQLRDRLHQYSSVVTKLANLRASSLPK